MGTCLIQSLHHELSAQRPPDAARVLLSATGPGLPCFPWPSWHCLEVLSSCFRSYPCKTAAIWSIARKWLGVATRTPCLGFVIWISPADNSLRKFLIVASCMYISEMKKSAASRTQHAGSCSQQAVEPDLKYSRTGCAIILGRAWLVVKLSEIPKNTGLRIKERVMTSVLSIKSPEELWEGLKASVYSRDFSIVFCSKGCYWVHAVPRWGLGA